MPSTQPFPKPKPEPSPVRRRASALAAAAAAAVLVMAACSGDVHHTHRTFRSALDRGASCAELFAQRARFQNQETLVKIDADLRRIGCSSPDAKRTDR